MRLRVRDLMRQLRAKGVSDTRGCLTKAELVNLLANVPQVTLLMDDVMEESQSTSHANNNTNSNQVLLVFEDWNMMKLFCIGP